MHNIAWAYFLSDAGALARKPPKRRSLLDAWFYLVILGELLPIWLRPDLRVMLPLEESYEEACEVLQINYCFNGPVMSWKQITIAGKPADIFTPAVPPKFALLFLHPHGDETLAHPAANYTEALAAARLACCCPHASKTWWSDKIYPPFDETMSAEAFVLDHVVPWMREAWNLPERAIAVAGISMGGQGALRLGFQQSERFPVVAGVASAIDYQVLFDDPAFAELPRLYRSKEQCRQDTATLHVSPPAVPRHIWFACDPLDAVWHPGNDRLHEKLRAVGVQHIADLESSHGGHTWDYFNAMAKPMMDFIINALQKESRRLM